MRRLLHGNSAGDLQLGRGGPGQHGRSVPQLTMSWDAPALFTNEQAQNAGNLVGH